MNLEISSLRAPFFATSLNISSPVGYIKQCYKILIDKNYDFNMQKILIIKIGRTLMVSFY